MYTALMENSSKRMADEDYLVKTLKQAGFTTVTRQLFFVNNELKALFLDAGKYRFLEATQISI